MLPLMVMELNSRPLSTGSHMVHYLVHMRKKEERIRRTQILSLIRMIMRT